MNVCTITLFILYLRENVKYSGVSVHLIVVNGSITMVLLKVLPEWSQAFYQTKYIITQLAAKVS